MLRRVPQGLLRDAAGAAGAHPHPPLCAESDTLICALEAELGGDAGVAGSPARCACWQCQTSVPALQEQTRSKHPAFS